MSERIETAAEGETVIIRKEDGTGVAFGRFVSIEESDTGKLCIFIEDRGKERAWVVAEGYKLWRPLSVTRVFKYEQPQSDEDRRGRKLKELRHRLEKLGEDDITDSPARFRLEKQIYDLEHERAAEEWPELIGA